MNQHLIIVSLLDGKGPTGVEAHFNQLIDAARTAGIEAVLVSAYPSGRWWATLARKLTALLRMVDAERAEILSLRINGKILAGKLAEQLARANGAVTLYAQDPLSAGVALRVTLQAGQGRRCRVVAAIHYNASQADELLGKGEATTDGPLCRFLLAAEAASLPRVDHLVFVSAYMQNHLRWRLPVLRAVPQSVIPNFTVDGAPCAGAPADSLPVAGDLVAIGTLEPRKNQAFLLQVLARAKARGHTYTLTLVGNGPDQAMLMGLSSRLGLQDQVVFAGFQKHAARLIPRYRLVVHAALLENMPIALIEALAVGRPILAPAVGGIPEVFRDGVEGYFWPLDDIDAAASLLIKTLSDSATYHRLARAALARYQQTFHSDKLVGRWLATILDARLPEPQAVP